MTVASRARAVPPSLVLAARSGDPDALVQLLASAQPDIRRYARRNCRNASDIDDAVQETLILLHRRIGGLRAIESFSYWLVRIVDRVCLRLARRLLGMQIPVDTLEDEVFPGASDVALRLDLASALESLPDHYREVVILRDVNEQTIDEIAAHLGLTRQSVKARLYRARQLVREYILQ